MLNFNKYLLSIIGLLLCSSFVAVSPEIKVFQYKCLVQLANYTGEGPYIVVSVLDSEDKYIQTLQVSGEDEDWYESIKDWWEYFEENNPDIDAISRPSIQAGARAIFGLSIDEKLLNVGNKLRFESAVEDQKYVKDDLLLPLTTETLKNKFEGTGYIRYIRIIPNN